jgi:hypothetical protein
VRLEIATTPFNKKGKGKEIACLKKLPESSATEKKRNAKSHR